MAKSKQTVIDKSITPEEVDMMVKVIESHAETNDRIEQLFTCLPAKD